MGFDKIAQTQQSQAVMNENLNYLKLFTGIDFQAPYYLNGFLLNPNLFAPGSLRI